MGKMSLKFTRGITFLVIACSLLAGLASSPAAAQGGTVCFVPTESQLGTLQFADLDGDGILGPSELDRVAGLSPELRDLIAEFRAEGYDSIQYQGCTPTTPTVTATPPTVTATPPTVTPTPPTVTATPPTVTATPPTVTATPETPTATATATSPVTETPLTPVPTEIPLDKTVLVDAATCDVEECPPYSSFLGGFTISIHDDATGDVLDTCTTPEDGSECDLVIPGSVENFYFSWDPADVPEGYLFKEVHRTTGSTGPVVYTLVLVPASSEVTTLLVNAAICDTVECPTYADWLDNFEIFARETGTGTILAYCATIPETQADTCTLQIPAGADYYLDFDPDQVPAGYVFSRVDVSDGEMGPVIHTLVFVPETPVTPTATATQEPTHEPTHEPTKAPTQPVSNLPSTGQGASDSASTMTMIAMVSGAGLLLAGAWLIRSRSRA